ncbi:MAG: ABC transporter ATP-binding protein [Desulfobulbaceae bacterium]|nr:ABC transporter ATP-binding protein [Desulfobulbaceae bacterium]
MIEINDLAVCLGEFRLRGITLSIEEGAFFALMGPTGSGKTVLLEAIAGLVPIQGGSIHLKQRDITRLPPEKRGIGIMYQDYALFPHLTVAGNITFGLRYGARDGHKAEKHFSTLVDALGIDHVLQRYPETLSGGELQRAALARALIVEPRVVLLDEPLSALDPNFREDIRAMLGEIHHSLGVTFVIVTHDFAEALSLASRAAVMHDGTIRQVGTIQDIFRKPTSSFVADFVGMKNIFAATFEQNAARLDQFALQVMGRPVNGGGHIAIRPEDITLSLSAGTALDGNCVPGVVTGIVDQGIFYEVRVSAGDQLFCTVVTKSAAFDLSLAVGMSVHLSFPPQAVHVF